MKPIITILFLLFIIPVYSQSDTIKKENEYKVYQNFVFSYCKNCKNRHGISLCSCRYNELYVGYSYDYNHWLEFGFIKDWGNCFPDVGYKSLYFSLISSYNDKPISGLKISYFRDSFFNVFFSFLDLGITVEALTDFTKTDLNLRPEIEFGWFGRQKNLRVCYGYNFPCVNNDIIDKGTHQITLKFIVLRKGGRS